MRRNDPLFPSLCSQLHCPLLGGKGEIVTSSDLEQQAIALEEIGDYLTASLKYGEAAWLCPDPVHAKELLDCQLQCLMKG